MSSPKSDQKASNSDGDPDTKSVEDTTTVKIKDEPADSGYEKAPGTPGISDNNSSSNSRSSSPCPPVHFGSASPAQGRDSPSQGSSSGPQLNDIYAGSTIRTHLQGGSAGKKTDTVQNIVEGLLKKNATLLAMSDTESLRPNRRNKSQETSNGKKEQNFPPVHSSVKFPISSNTQARLVQTMGKKSIEKPMLLRPKSPTKRCDSILRDKSMLSYSLMESVVGDETIEKIFKVQQHELVCAVSSKPYIFDKTRNEKRVVASLDNNYFWCNFCSFSSSNKSLITNHIMDHRFSCKYCAYESFCRSDILRHTSKMHDEFDEMSTNLSYCTFLSDYLRIKSRADGKENNASPIDQDEDVDEVDTETMKSYHAANVKRKHEDEESQGSISEKWAKMDSPDESSTNGVKSDRPGKSRKSQNPRRLPQVNEKDYDTFEMEVEEIEESENANESGNADKILYPSSSDHLNDPRNSPAAVPHMQLIPSLQDEGTHGFAATHVTRTPPPVRAGRPPTYMANNRANNRGTHRSASASSLYWSCGYCDFQSSSQAEIKEHSNRTHPGKPHRLVLNASTSLVVDQDCDQSLPPNDDALINKERSSDTDDILPSSPTLKESAVIINVDDELDSCNSEERAGKVVLDNDSEKGLHDIHAENVVDNLVKPTQGTVSFDLDDSNSKFSKSVNTNLDNDEEDQGGTESQCQDDLTVKESKASVHDEEGVSPQSSSLKLTFRTVGDKTVCSMAEKSETESATSIQGLEELEMSHDKAKHFSRQLEEELIDSLSDSGSDTSSFVARSVALSVSSISEDFDAKYKDLEELRHSAEMQKSEAARNEKSMHQASSPMDKNEKQVHFDFVPARSAAVKALTKMKPVVDNEDEDSDDKESEISGSKKSHVKSKSSGPCSDSRSDKSVPASSASENTRYTCNYCSAIPASPLRRVKSHLSNQHPELIPAVVNAKMKHSAKKRNTLYVCPFSTCNKLFSCYDALLLHRASHPSLSSYSSKASRLKERSASCSSAESCSLSTSFPEPLHVPSGSENIPNCRVLLHPLVATKLEIVQQPTNQPVSRDPERFECLYCTEHFSHITLTGIKQHYAKEHPNQLLVLRDNEAKKEKMVSRIYACEESDCTFTSASRGEVDSHSKCHKTNCTYVYECAGCGWFSSSLWLAKDHLKKDHSPDENVDLIHMQLLVDENGQTSKKILRPVGCLNVD